MSHIFWLPILTNENLAPRLHQYLYSSFSYTYINLSSPVYAHLRKNLVPSVFLNRLISPIFNIPHLPMLKYCTKSLHHRERPLADNLYIFCPTECLELPSHWTPQAAPPPRIVIHFSRISLHFRFTFMFFICHFSHKLYTTKLRPILLDTVEALIPPALPVTLIRSAIIHILLHCPAIVHGFRHPDSWDYYHLS